MRQNNNTAYLVWALLAGGLLLVLLTSLASCGTISVTEKLKGQGDNAPTAERTTKSSGGLPWGKDPAVPEDQGALKLKGEAGKGESSAGEASSGGTEWKIIAASGTAPLYIMGGMLVIAGIAVIVIFKAYWTGIVTAGAGLLLIVFVSLVDTYPEVFLALLLGGVGIGCYYFYRIWRGKKYEAVAGDVIAAIKGFREKHPENWTALKTQLAANIDRAEKTLVDKLDNKAEPRNTG